MEAQEKIEIPEITYQGDDKKLKERIFKFKAGSFRIAIFTIVGFVMGAYSHIYVSIGFFPVKLILAIPYKVSEAIYVSVIGTDGVPWQEGEYLFSTVFFPHSHIATFLAEICTAILISGAVYGALAYFTGDKRVFTMQRFVKFGALWCGAILLTIGGAYLVNAKAVYDNEHLRGEPHFTVYDSRGNGRGVGGGETGQRMKEYFYSELAEADIYRDYGEELPLGIVFNDVRCCVCRVNYEKMYLVTEQGKLYHISEEFARIIRQYEEEGVILPGLPQSESAAEIIGRGEALPGGCRIPAGRQGGTFFGENITRHGQKVLALGRTGGTAG